MKKRDFDEEKIFDKMFELRQKVDEELLNNELKSAKIMDKEQTFKNKVLNVKYLGKQKFKEQIEGEILYNDKGMYLVEYQIEKTDGSIVNCERYYTEDLEMVAGNVLGDGFDIELSETFANKSLNEIEKLYSEEEKKDILDKLKGLDKDGILDLNEMEKEKIAKIAKTLGIKEEDIENLTEIDEESLKQSEEELEKIPGKTDMDLNKKVTAEKNLGQVLGVQGEGYVKLSVIQSKKLKGNDNTTGFTFVGVKKDGSVEKIDNLIQKKGKTPNEEVQSMNSDGSEVKTIKPESMFEIKGASNVNDTKYLTVDIGEGGRIDVDYARVDKSDPDKIISTPVKTKNTKAIDGDVLEISSHNQNVEIDDEYVSFVAKEMMENSEIIGEVYNKSDLKYYINQMIQEEPNIDKEEIRGKLEKQAENERVIGQDGRNK